VKRGARRCGCEVVDAGLCTTPQLHYLVAQQNEGGVEYALQLCSNARIATPTELCVDCAGGVGAIAAKQLRDIPNLSLKILNGPGDATLNERCGAEYVQKERKPPVNFDETHARCCCLDGDADRLVYFYWSSGEPRVLDGDKIAALLALYFADRLPPDTSFGVVQTAYANGASTRFLRGLRGLTIATAKTGVKHLHRRALDFDLAVYFEANGHGTVLFNNVPASLDRFRRLANQTVGDALADALLVETVLSELGWSLADWDAIYADLPSRMLKLTVPDRRALRTRDDDESRLVEPIALQAALDRLVADAGDAARAFVRPSGTEDVVRIYAEAATQQAADDLAHACRAAVLRFAD